MTYLDVRRIFKTLLEGGHAVYNADRILAADAERISDEIIGELKKNGWVASAAGSTGKKKQDDTSGDIDILIQGVKIPQLVKDLEDFITRTYQQDEFGHSGGEIHWGYRYKNNSGEDKIAQIDFEIVPDIDMGRFFRHSPDFRHDESNWKGMYRTALLVQLAKTRPLDESKYPTVLFTKDDNVPAEYIDTPKTFYNLSLMSRGLYIKHRTYCGKKKPRVATASVIEEKLIARDPDKIIEIILGPKANRDTVNSLEDLTRFVLSGDYPYRDEKTLSRIFYRLCYDDLLFRDNDHEDVTPKREELFKYFMSCMKHAGMTYIKPDEVDSLTE